MLWVGAALVFGIFFFPAITKAVQEETDVRSVPEMILGTFPDAPIMVEVARAESSFDCSAKNPNSSAKGCFQILDGTWRDYGCEGDVLDAMDNIICARKIYDRSGLTPWDESKANW